MSPLEIVGAILGSLAVIGGFLYWHFNTVNGFKDEIHKQDLRIKDLETSDKLQQQTIDQLNALFPTLHEAVKIIGEKKKR